MLEEEGGGLPVTAIRSGQIKEQLCLYRGFVYLKDAKSRERGLRNGNEKPKEPDSVQKHPGETPHSSSVVNKGQQPILQMYQEAGC